MVIDSTINSLTPGKCVCDLKLIFKIHIKDIYRPILSILREIAVRLMSLNLTDDSSTLVQVMAWCRQATSVVAFVWLWLMEEIMTEIDPTNTTQLLLNTLN